MKTVARFVTRMQGNNDGLFIGTSLLGQEDLEPNTVYEIRNVLGVLTIHKVGQSCGIDYNASEQVEVKSKSHLWFGRLFSWLYPIGDILEARQQSLFLTRDEFDDIHKESDDGKNC